MYARDKSQSGLSRRCLLILGVCTCALAFHFIAEDVAAIGSVPGMNLTVQTGLAGSLHEHGEDQFVPPLLSSAPVDSSGICLVPQIMSNTHIFSPSPQPPPPNC
jgi:hypothetical protein